MHVSWVVALPTLLYRDLTLFLFFAGLYIFLFHISDSVSSAVVGWVGFPAAIYAITTLLPIVRHDNPYYTPLSSTAWFLYASIRYMISGVLFVVVFCFSVKINRRVGGLSYQCRKWIVRGVEKAAEEIAKKRSSDIDPCILQSTEPLGEDRAREQFFEAIAGFKRSQGSSS